MADPAAVDEAIRVKLKNDATLAGLMPGGVFMDVSASGKTQFVIVSLVTHEDEYVFEGSAFEKSTYLIKAVDNSNSATAVKAAAARIHALLQDQPLTIAGYVHSLTRRSERVRYTEVDEANKDIRWQHQGGRYDVFVSPT